MEPDELSLDSSDDEQWERALKRIEAREVPPRRMSAREKVVARFERLWAQKERGISYAEMAEVLKSEGIAIAPDTLAQYLNREHRRRHPAATNRSRQRLSLPLPPTHHKR